MSLQCNARCASERAGGGGEALWPRPSSPSVRSGAAAPCCCPVAAFLLKCLCLVWPTNPYLLTVFERDGRCTHCRHHHRFLSASPLSSFFPLPSSRTDGAAHRRWPPPMDIAWTTPPPRRRPEHSVPPPVALGAQRMRSTAGRTAFTLRVIRWLRRPDHHGFI